MDGKKALIGLVMVIAGAVFAASGLDTDNLGLGQLAIGAGAVLLAQNSVPNGAEEGEEA